METLIRVFGPIVSTFFVTNGGVTLSEIARRQAEHKQQNDKFWTLVKEATGGIFQEIATVLEASGSASQALPCVVANPQEFEEYAHVADRNAETGVLMHGVKLHKELYEKLQRLDLRLHVVDALPEAPAHPVRARCGTYGDTEDFMEMDNIDQMIGALKPEVLDQFDFSFWKNANSLNSSAAVIGKLLSERDAFFRKLVSPAPQAMRDKSATGVIIMSWKRSYNDEQFAAFIALRDTLRVVYENLQRELNSCRKQIKDAVRAYDRAEEERYQSEHGVYQLKAREYALEEERIRAAAEVLRQQAFAELAALRVRTR